MLRALSSIIILLLLVGSTLVLPAQSLANSNSMVSAAGATESGPLTAYSKKPIPLPLNLQWQQQGSGGDDDNNNDDDGSNNNNSNNNNDNYYYSNNVRIINGFATVAATTGNDRNHAMIDLDFGGFIDLGELKYNGNNIGRTLVYGSGDIVALSKSAGVTGLGGIMQNGKPLLGVAISESPLPSNLGFSYSPDPPLQFDALLLQSAATIVDNNYNYSFPLDPGRYSGSYIVGSDMAARNYNATGSGVKVAIVDTGTDFSNPDMRHSLARDENGLPIMLDADGQGLVLTRAKYIANIDNSTGRIQNYSSSSSSATTTNITITNSTAAGPKLPEGITSYVYVNGTGVYLRVSQGKIPVYNTLYPFFGPPVLEATATVDWKIGNGPTDYIRSKSGIYRLGVEFQTQLHFGTLTFGLVPVLLVDSKEPGVYDTIIPDMSAAWYFYVLTQLGRLMDSRHLMPPTASWDFTDEPQIRLGEGNEFLVYDYNKDGYPDFSAGTAGARVVDIWQVINNKTRITLAHPTGYGGAILADLLEPLDPKGEYFGLMYDLQGHGTSTAATIASRGEHRYAIYSNSTQYRLTGIAPDAKIIPIKALWAGDAIYGWLYAAGFDLDRQNGKWNYSGNHKAEIISNSWGVASFPLLEYGQGYDILSVLSSLLMVPGFLDDDYPGTVVVNSVGNNGLGYGSVGSPNASPLAISVGATTNNVHIGYNGFANITRFGGSAAPFDEVSDFSSRGPGLFGDPKPELMAVGSYAFTPTIVTVKNLQSRAGDPNDDGAFALFGGTSMAAPMVAGAAALVIQDMRANKGIVTARTGTAAGAAGDTPTTNLVDPFTVKSVLMSTAKDLKNDPFVQGSGRVDAAAAIGLLRGTNSKFLAYTEDTVPNILSAMSRALYAYNDTLGIVGQGQGINATTTTISENNNGDSNDNKGSITTTTKFKLKESRWFAGYIEQGKSASTEIVIENPSKKVITVEVSPVIEKLVARYEIRNTTRLFEKDPLYNSKEFGYVPNYYNLTKEIGSIPKNSDLMVAKVNFPFASFMNLTEFYGDHLRIASIYAYDWADTNRDGNVSYTETSMINRGGSWGTVQELRVADPAQKFRNTPLIGVYPVPSIFSFWRGDRQINSTAMNYTLTIEFYKRQPNPSIEVGSIVPGKAFVSVGPEGRAKVAAAIVTREDTLPGVYYSSIMITESSSGNNNNDDDGRRSSNNSVLVPVSYIVTSKPVPKDVPVVIAPPPPHTRQDEGKLGLRPNGYVGGLFDMTSRYAAGDWRSYYFAVNDSTITSMSLKISWPHNSTSINAMAFGPDGKLVASSVPAGVFQTFAGWASNDWLGTTSFSEGGAFYFSQNGGKNATLLYVPVNQTGVYSILVHNTLFHGESLYEPVQVEAKFSTILPDGAPPAIKIDLPKYFGSSQYKVPVTIVEENIADYSYTIDIDDPIKPSAYLNSNSSNTFDVMVDGSRLEEGIHRLRIDVSDLVGHTSSFVSTFEVDKTPPSADIFIRIQNTGDNIGSNYNNSTNNMQRLTGDKIIISDGIVLLSWNVTDKNGVAENVSVTVPAPLGNGNNDDNNSNSNNNSSNTAITAATTTTTTTAAATYPSSLWPSYITIFNSSSMQEGMHYWVSISARDLPGNNMTRNLQVIVDRTAPDTSLSVLGDPSNLMGTAKIAIKAKDPNLSTATLEVGNNKKLIDVTGLDEYSLDTTELPDGTYQLKLVASDRAGNSDVSITTITVTNTRPQVVATGLIGLAAGAGIATIVWVFLARRHRPWSRQVA